MMIGEFVPRFWNKVVIGDDCWTWQGASHQQGYGLFQLGTRQLVRAHRQAWIYWNGPIPSGFWVLHHCDNPRCIKPAHLYLGTAKDNARDREARQRSRNARTTHCPHGHPYDEINTGMDRGKRHCRKCDACRKRDERRRRREQHADLGRDGGIFAFGDAVHRGNALWGG